MRAGVIESQAELTGGRRAPARSAQRLPEALVAQAVIFDGHRTADVRELSLKAPEDGDVVVDVLWSGISTGTERLMWSGDMPAFPGMGYPLVPGYEAVGRLAHAPSEYVFIPGARCFKDAHGLFGGAASRLVVPASKVQPIRLDEPREGVLLALAATAHHAIAGGDLPELIIGHGVLGRLAARLVVAMGGSPTVWDVTAARRHGARGYSVIAPEDEERRNYAAICDMSGDAAILDAALPFLAPGGEICLAGFYSARPSFSFPLAFRKEMRLRVAAEWRASDLAAVVALLNAGRLDLSGLITHARPAHEASAAYAQAFSDSACLKMILDWESSDA
jgi:bacteriochlorophyllide a dehydrogenase